MPRFVKCFLLFPNNYFWICINMILTVIYVKQHTFLMFDIKHVLLRATYLNSMCL